MVSKTVSDKLRAHLLAQGIEGIPANNTAVFNILQEHGMLQATSEGKAIWKAAITSESGWSHSFTLLRLAPALIWEASERPTAFTGTVVIEATDKSASADTSGITASPDVSEPMSDSTAQPSASELAPSTPTATSSADAMDELVSLMETSQASEREAPIQPATLPAPVDVPPPSSPPEASPIPTQPDAHTTPSADHFMVWLKHALATRKLILNDAKALIHTVDGTVFLVTPGIFQRYAQEHPQTAAFAKAEGQQDWQWLQKRFEKLGIHRKQTNGLNIWTCEVTGPRKSRRLYGYLLADCLNEIIRSSHFLVSAAMSQLSLCDSGFERHPVKTRKRLFLEQMEQVVPWADLVALITPHAPAGGSAKGGRPPFAVETMLRIHFLQQWFNLSDPAMQEALHDIPMFRRFAGLDLGEQRMPDESTILRFRHLLERHGIGEKILSKVNELLTHKGLLFKAGTLVDATIIAAPSSTKNKTGTRDPEMASTRKGQQCYFGMKAHTGVDADSGLVHTVAGTSANRHDVTQAVDLLHGEEEAAFGDAGYQGVEKRAEVQAQHPQVTWYTAMRPGKRRALDKTTELGKTLERLEQLKAKLRAKVEHPFRVIKRQFGYVKVHYRGLAKNTAQLHTLFALSNLWMVRRQLLPAKG